MTHMAQAGPEPRDRPFFKNRFSSLWTGKSPILSGNGGQSLDRNGETGYNTTTTNAQKGRSIPVFHTQRAVGWCKDAVGAGRSGPGAVFLKG